MFTILENDKSIEWKFKPLLKIDDNMQLVGINWTFLDIELFI